MSRASNTIEHVTTMQSNEQHNHVRESRHGLEALVQGRNLNEEDVEVDVATLPPFKIRGHRLPNFFMTREKYYFINGVQRLEEFADLTPMSEELAKVFRQDYTTMSSEALYSKYKEYATDRNEENDAIVQGT